MSKSKKAPAAKQSNGARKSVRKEVEKVEVKTESTEDEIIVIDPSEILSPKRKESSPGVSGNLSKRFKPNETVKSEKKDAELDAVIKKEIEEVSKIFLMYEDSSSSSVDMVLDPNAKKDEFCMSLEERKNLIKLGEERNNPDKFDYYLKNFSDAINTVLFREEFSYLFDQNDYEIIKKFMSLKHENKIIYVRLFQRKLTWLPIESINYLDKISGQRTSTENLKNIEKIESQVAKSSVVDEESRHIHETCLSELCKELFIFDESKIDNYEEILDLLKLPQLKQLAKECHIKNINQKINLKSDYVQLILDHFKKQRNLFSMKSFFTGQDKSKSGSGPINPVFMKQCKTVLGKSYKINKEYSDVFIRILMLYSLSTTSHVDLTNGKEMGQQLLQNVLLSRMGKVKYMDYEINLTSRIYENRNSFINYQKALEIKYELLNYLDRKEIEVAYNRFHGPIVNELKKILLNDNIFKYDTTLPGYLRSYKCGSVYARFLSIYASEVLEKLRKYQEANELFEFLLYEQKFYAGKAKAKWYERLTLNYEMHLSDPVKAFEALKAALSDNHVKKAGRLNLHQRLIKMSNTKKYAKLGLEFNELVKNLCEEEKYEFIEAPTVEIEGTILDPEVIPGRKTIFIQNFERSNSGSKLDETTVELVPKLGPVKTHDDSSSSDSSNPGSPSQSSTDNKGYLYKRASLQSSNVLIENRYHISVEEVALKHYVQNLGFTNGKHSETSVILTIYGLIFWDIVFDPTVGNVFIDNFQSAPLDISSESFYHSRKTQVDERLSLIENSSIEVICELMGNIWMKYNGVVSSLVNWNLFQDPEEISSLVRCFEPIQLKSLCEYICKNYSHCHSGGPDLILWSTVTNKLKFVEVKGPGDRLSYKQKVWLDFFIRNSIACEVCYVKGKKAKRLE